MHGPCSKPPTDEEAEATLLRVNEVRISEKRSFQKISDTRCSTERACLNDSWNLPNHATAPQTSRK